MSLDSIEQLPPAVRQKYNAAPPFIQDAVLRGARLRGLLNDEIMSRLRAASASKSWAQAQAILSPLAPKHPPESMLEGLLFFFALNDENENAELVRSLLDLLAEHTQTLRDDERESQKRNAEEQGSASEAVQPGE